MGYANDKIIGKIKKAEELINEIESKIKISKNCLITLGCYSECWDENNKTETIKLIEYFLKKGNQIQLATKKRIYVEEIMQLKNLIKYLGQFVIFVSSASVSEAERIEKNTTRPEERFKTFEISRELNIPTVLYIKPVLKGITIKDIEIYKTVIRKYNIKDVVIGSIFEEEGTSEKIHFSDNKDLFYNPNTDEIKIIKELSKMKNVKVYRRSSEVMKFYEL